MNRAPTIMEIRAKPAPTFLLILNQLKNRETLTQLTFLESLARPLAAKNENG
ncbi:MAG: hypothetical protein NUK62_08365 [Tenericutes bacterium]|nr:hypothetical protein [Mycoplasmatota bacterium]